MTPSPASSPTPPTDTVAASVHDLGAIPDAFWQAARSGRLGRLGPGETLEISAPADPIACWHLLEALLPGRFSWDYLVRQPGDVRVAIGRQA